MKFKKSRRLRAHARNIIKLCYIFIILCALYILKVNIFPESDFERYLAMKETALMLEYVFHSTLILCVGTFMLEKIVFRE